MGSKTITNWSGNRTVHVDSYFEPQSTAEIKDILDKCQGRKIRVIGSNMSPSGFPPCSDVVICTRNLCKILSVDKQNKLVTIEPGVQIQDLLDHLKTFDLMIHNLPATTGMTLGGLTQASCHGTGIDLPPLDEAVHQLTLYTADGQLKTLSNRNGEHFYNARCSLGTFGIVTEIVLRVVPLCYLKEELKVLDFNDVKAQHLNALKTYKHLKYHHIPFTSKVIAYYHNEITEEECKKIQSQTKPEVKARVQKAKLLEMYFGILQEKTSNLKFDEEFLQKYETLSFSELRGRILAHDALNPDFVKKLNIAELDYWTYCQGIKADISYKLLIFDCGGRQHVKEFAFEIAHDYHDLAVVENIKNMIEANKIPAHAPIEQRWSSGSHAWISPVYSKFPERAKFCWVGIIMYLDQDPHHDEKITSKFEDYYVSLIENFLEKDGLNEHLCKIALTKKNKPIMDKRLEKLAPILTNFIEMRKQWDKYDTFYHKEVSAIIEKIDV